MILTSCFCTCCTKIGSRDFPFACKLWHQNLFSLEYRVIHGPREMERVVLCWKRKRNGCEIFIHSGNRNGKNQIETLKYDWLSPRFCSNCV